MLVANAMEEGKTHIMMHCLLITAIPCVCGKLVGLSPYMYLAMEKPPQTMPCPVAHPHIAQIRGGGGGREATFYTD